MFVNKTSLLLFILLGFAHLVQTPWLRGQESVLPIELKILTYNIHHGEGTDGKVDLHRLAEVNTLVD